MSYKNKRTKLLVTAGTLFLIVCLALLWWHKSNQQMTKLSTNSPESSKATNQIGHSQPSGVIDKQGQGVEKNSNPTVSASGKITIEQPANGAKVATGSILSGEADVPTVQYRVKDSVMGVIAQGSLEVVNGKFSGSLVVNSSASGGTLEVFSLDSTTGSEKNNVSVSVTF